MLCLSCHLPDSATSDPIGSRRMKDPSLAGDGTETETDEVGHERDTRCRCRGSEEGGDENEQDHPSATSDG